MPKPRRKKPLLTYTIPVGDAVIGARCSCPKGTPGNWLVELDGKLHVFDPSTQLQKDIWLSSNREAGVPEETALGALRWQCHACGVVQMP